MTEKERGFQQAIIELAQLVGYRVAHFRPARTAQGWRTPVAADGAGFPDLVLVRERVLFVECKSERGRLTKDQEAWRDALLAAGAEWYEWRPNSWREIEETLTR